MINGSAPAAWRINSLPYGKVCQLFQTPNGWQKNDRDCQNNDNKSFVNFPVPLSNLHNGGRHENKIYGAESKLGKDQEEIYNPPKKSENIELN